MPIRASLDDETIHEIREAFLAGEPMKAIADDLDVSVATVAKYTRHLPQEGKVREARRVAILAALGEGLTVEDTAAKVGCRVSVVVAIVNAMGEGEQ